MRNAGPDEMQAGIKIAGRNINNLRYVDDTTLMAGKKNKQITKRKTNGSLFTHALHRPRSTQQ